MVQSIFQSSSPKEGTRIAIEGEMPFDWSNGSELCHSTGYRVFSDGQWWNEYEDSEGNLWLGS